MVASIHGSSMLSMRLGSGMSAGLCSSIVCAGSFFEWVRCILYTTLGAVVMRSRSYSRVSRSWMISRCSRPRKPQRKPKPSAALLSVSKLNDASLRRSLYRLSRSFSKSAASTGNRPQNTTGWTSLNPGSASAVGRLASVIVSPTRVSATSLICAVMKPISPARELRQLLDLGAHAADAVDQVGRARGHELDLLALLQDAVDHADQDDDAEVGVVPAVDEHRLQRRVAVALGRRDPGRRSPAAPRRCRCRSWRRRGPPRTRRGR